MIVEVFKTNVNDRAHAKMLLHQIEKTFPGHKATFDLTDCDRILRVQCESGKVSTTLLISLLKDNGFYAEVLQEENPSVKGINGVFKS